MSFRAASGALGLLLLAACAAPESHAMVDGTPAVDGQISAADAAAFASICEPIIDPLPRPAWSRDQLVIELDEGIQLSDQDIDEILALAYEAGMTEPVSLSAGNRIQIGWRFQVQLQGHASEDPKARTRTTRTLSLCCPEWREVNDSLFHPAGNGGGWEIDDDDLYSTSPWSDWTTRFIRHTDQVWEFRTSESVTFELAYQILLAFARNDFVDEVPAELPDFLRIPVHQSRGQLGRVTEKYDHVEHISPRPDPLSMPWHFRIEFPSGLYSGLIREFALRKGGWVLIGLSAWGC